MKVIEEDQSLCPASLNACRLVRVCVSVCVCVCVCVSDLDSSSVRGVG